MRLTIFSTFILLIAGCGSSGDSPAPQSAAQQRVLSIQPIAQEETDWCYAASAQMIFIYYGLPSVNSANYQCGVVAVFNAYVYPQYPQCAGDCTLCAQVGGGLLDTIQQLIDQYGVIANQGGFQSRVLTSTEAFYPLDMQTIIDEISAGRPILAGITPGGYPYPDVSQHAVVIVGFDTTGASPLLIVNDPFPYDAFFGQVPNPYSAFGGTERQPGQYAISYSSFVGQMVWANTIYHIQ
jgi:hypothetical protein